jgi:hypothetical protein
MRFAINPQTYKPFLNPEVEYTILNCAVGNRHHRNKPFRDSEDIQEKQVFNLC